MPRATILAGAYQSRAIITSAQRCINLYPEANDDPTSPAPVTHFPTPGLTLVGTPPAPGVGRKVYRATNGEVYEVTTDAVYYVDSNFAYHLLGHITPGSTPVSMMDNGLAIIIVNGIANQGWAIDLATHSFAAIVDPIFTGGVTVAYQDSFFILSTPEQDEWYISLSSVSFANLTQGVITPPSLYAAFDPLDFAIKTGSADPIACVASLNRNIWTFGVLESEIWYDAGAADFVFATMPGVYIHHGVAAPYSVAQTDIEVYWLGQDRQGTGLVFKGSASFEIKVISSRGIEAIIGKMAKIDDAIGNVFQVLGHPFYVLTFVTEGRTFACDIRSQYQWHELAYTGPNGFERHRANSYCFGYGMVLACDYQDGRLYHVNPAEFTDAGQPITRLRTIPHLLNDGKRIRLDRVIADVQGGTLGGNMNPQISLRTSYDRGGSFSDARIGDFGDTGDYGEFPWWPNLGMSRDFVLELSWSAPIDTALNGIFYEATPAGT